MRIMAVAVAVLLSAPLQAWSAAGYPQRPVRLIVPYAPGGGSDTIARVIGQKLAERLGQPFVIDTRPGAASLIGTEIAARASGDGYTLILS
ncbi:MAG: tripartite tricarboxylate transporter substrate binding protein, partial [Betaproteobacteria bacterium]|nr:tripartite tricarboxylate transporter substrate binding protein [Betaproteobacteria bacterium]